MTTNSLRAPLVAVLLAATASIALLASPALAAHLSTDVNNDLAKAQKASKDKDQAAVKTSLDKALADSKSDYDKFMTSQVTMQMAVQANDMATAEPAAEAAADSPYMQTDDMKPAEKAQTYRAALILSFNAKHYDKAKIYAKALEATNPTDPAVIATINQAYIQSGDFADATALTQKRIAASTAANGKPDRAALQSLLDIQVAQKDEAGAEATLEQQVANYNDPKDWTQIIDVALSTPGLRDVEAIWLGRLMFATGATPSAQDLTIVGQTADHLTFYGDADLAASHGGTGFANDSAKADADKKTLPAQIAAGQKQNATYSAKLAEALYSYGMYPEAEAAARLSISKGAATDPTEAPMVLGQTLTAEGKYDDAIAAFGQVTGGGPATARIVRLWTDYAKLKKNPPAAAPAAAPAPAPAK